jgi:hypothetical protein
MGQDDPLWSDDLENLENFKNFASEAKQQNKKVILVAGSMTPPISPHILEVFLTNNTQYGDVNSYFSFILLGYSKVIGVNKLNKFKSRVFISKAYVEYEDAIRYCDFAITNGGAGSVTIPMVYGCPQLIITSDSLPSGDKDVNKQDIRRLKLGPHFDEKNDKLNEIVKAFRNLKRSYSVYKNEAFKIKTLIQKYSGKNMLHKFLQDLQTNAGKQRKLSSAVVLPVEYQNRWKCFFQDE